MKRTKDSKSFFDPGYPGGAYDIVFDKIKDVQPLLLGLHEYGTVEEITAKIDRVMKTAEIVKRDFPGREETLFGLAKISAELEERGEQSAKMEKILAKRGLRIDPKTGRAVSIAKGHKGPVLLAECVRRIYTARPPGVRNTHFTRRKIAEILAPVFGEDLLRTDTKGLIYRAIDKWETRR